MHHGCPRTPRRLAWGWSLLLREANGFLAGAAWNSWGCYTWCPLAAGRHRWAALVARGLVGFWASLRSAGSLAHRLMCGAFFPTRGKEPKGDRWQPNRASTMAAPGPLVAWLRGGTSCCARLLASSRGRLGTALGVVPVVRWRPGGTGGPPSLRARWWACRACRSLSAGVEGQVGNGAVLRIGAWPEEPEQPPSASAGGRRLPQPWRSAQPPREAGRPQGSPARARATQPPSPEGKVSRLCRDG